ncbi:MAG TPA: sugar-transfer associated ATP-grasp domain-containing protein [Halanaerobiales bacterium]|nr:sugar-transfer associated ATP-grasp domain-containing protein [Halanaerobiales bacterium]
MYEYQLKMNPKDKRDILDDKRKFYKNYKDFIKHSIADISDIQNGSGIKEKIFNNKSGKVVLKVYDGKCGRDVLIKPLTEFDNGDLVRYMKKNNYDLAEEYVVQHPSLMKLSPSGLNTLRVITQLNNNNEVEILGVRLRITINSEVDNLAAGNIAAPVNIETGKVDGPGVYSDITKDDVYKHPVTGVDIVGFEVPYFKESIRLAIDAAKFNTSNRSIGWDIAITEDGPELIEGNHDWCKLLWQLPVKKGLKQVLEKYL